MTASEHSAHIRAQSKLVDASIASGSPLWATLNAAGWSYDDLRYRTQDRFIPKSYVPPLERLEAVGGSAPVVSFFAGGGGIDLGLESVGFKTKIAVEHNPLFCETLRLNFPDTTVIGPPGHDGDVSAPGEIINALAAAGLKRRFEGIFVGGPPCQSFSIAANQRFNKSGPNFKRTGFSHKENGNLLFDYISLICEFEPAAFFIENVPGLLEIDGGEQMREALKLLRSSGYVVEDPWVLDAADYGVPQRRRRLFVVGTRTGRAIGHMQRAETHRGCADVLGGLTLESANHETRRHSAESIARYMALEYGKRDQLGRVDRLHPLKPSKTVIAGGTNGGGRSHLHPLIPRTLSVRECARLQTFPDSYRFVGPSARQFTQVGNAVPPLLAARLGADVLAKLL